MRIVACLITIVSIAAFAVGGAAAKPGSHCKDIRTYQEAAQAGEMPAIVSALHGGAPIALTCNA